MWGGTTKAKENCVALVICISSCDRMEEKGGRRSVEGFVTRGR